MSLPKGETFNPLDLRKRIYEKRKEFPFLRPYVGPFAMMKALKRELDKGQIDPKVNFFAIELSDYVAFGKSFIHEQSETHNLEWGAFVIAFAHDAFEDPEFEESETLLEDFVRCFDPEDLLPMVREAFLATALLGYMRIPRFFHGWLYAAQLEKEAHIGEAFEILGRFRSMTLDFRMAAEDYLRGANVCFTEGNREKAARLACLGYAHASQIPGYPLPSEKEIRERYGKDAETVLAYPKRLAFKHDPVEFTSEFRLVYLVAMDEAYDEYEKIENPHIFQLWEAMEEAFAKRGIAWKNPRRMNPTMKFD